MDIIWTKPCGKEMKTNDLPANVEEAEKLGWKRKEIPKQRASKPEDQGNKVKKGK